MANFFLAPPHLVTGAGALSAAAGQLAGLGKKALLVADPMMTRLGNVTTLTQLLEGAGTPSSLFDEVDSEPTDTIVGRGLAQYRADGCDFLVAIGGGSSIDTMKAIALLAACGGRITDYMGKIVAAPLPAMAAIPTTAGTGSEATQFTIITDTENDVKMLLKGPSLLPGLAVVDPQFTKTAPPSVTAATGIDALCHAVEAFTSRKAQPMSDTFAVSAVKRILCFLSVAFAEPENEAARTEMALASLEAGIAFNNSSVTLIHGMSRPIGALFHVPHGLSNAMLMQVCLAFAVSGTYGRFAYLARACGLASTVDDDRTAASRLLHEISLLLRTLKIPSPAGYGIDRAAFEKNIDKMARDAMASGSPANTRREITVEDIKALYLALWNGVA